uniref:Uncharacterized protein n=1 Tax=Chrysemys picta bellii TaxID=8478 RepID=A0A8C3IJX4_CHRPI
MRAPGTPPPRGLLPSQTNGSPDAWVPSPISSPPPLGLPAAGAGSLPPAPHNGTSRRQPHSPRGSPAPSSWGPSPPSLRGQQGCQPCRWVLWCLMKLEPWLKLLPQCWQSELSTKLRPQSGRSPVWVRWCCTRWELREKALPQSVQRKGFSPVWVRRCVARSELSPKRLPQSVHG